MTKSCCSCPACASGAATMHNRPGLGRVSRRIGTHQCFFEAMVARLSANEFARLDPLRSRSSDDPSIALLDAWSLVGDVLTFYQEQIANEAYLRTATERRSLVEIARLVGYRPRPGVAATAHLAFSLENQSEPAEIPKGTRVNSVPAPGETMVAFETSEPVLARRQWNTFTPRLTRPQTSVDLAANGGLYVNGTKTRLKPTDPLLLRIGNGALQLCFVRAIIVDEDKDRTLVMIDKPKVRKRTPSDPKALNVFGIPISNLARPEAVPPPSSAAMRRSVEMSFATGADTLPRLLGKVQPALGKTLYRTLQNLPAPPVAEPIRLYAMRIDARPFGHNAPLRLAGLDGNKVPIMVEWPGPLETLDIPLGHTAFHEEIRVHTEKLLFLDNDYDMLDDSLVVVARDGAKPLVLDSGQANFQRISLNAYSMSGKSVRIDWTKAESSKRWLEKEDKFEVVRTTRVFAGSEELGLAEAPIMDDVAGNNVELAGVYDGLEAGRWLIVEGERTDILDANGLAVPGIRAAELVMLQRVEQSSAKFPPEAATPALAAASASAGTPASANVEPEDKLRTILTITAEANGSEGLAYRYKRDTVQIRGNVASATHGETKAEVLGSGDASLALQSFALKQRPLTHMTAASPSGTETTLEIRVNDLLWREEPSIAALTPTDHAYVTRDDDEGVTSIVFGNGVRGARVPSGHENVKAAYRVGIGRPGNVRAGSLSLLATRPLGVKEVVNPLPASGGADREGLGSIRRNAPIALMALDRLVSRPDYANFARAFGGVGKASSARLEGGDIGIFIAGVDDAPIAPGSPLIRNLADAMRRFGDPQVQVSVAPRERLVLLIQANVLIEPDRQWTQMEPAIRAALLEEFSFSRVELGESLPLARAVKAIQAVAGVSYADIDIFDQLGEAAILEGIAKGPAEKLKRQDLIEVLPGQIAYLAPDVPDTLILQELKS